MEIISNSKTQTNTVEVEFKATAEEFEAEVQATFLKQKKNISIPGFRKGKATRKMIETHYGEGVFYQDAVNGLYNKLISEVIDELKLDVVDMPEVSVEEISKENGVSFKASFTVKPEVKISDYKGLKVNKTVKTISDEMVDNEINRLRERGARIVDVTDRAAENGDTVVFDFEGFVDGEAFEGGKADKFSLELGSGRFIPGFEEQIVGKNIDEEFDVNVTFPEDYNAENLKGKPAVFKCKLYEIKAKELADLDDDFAKDVSEFDTLADLKADLKAKLEEHAKTEAEQKADADLTDLVIEKMDAEVPAAMFENRIDDLVREWENRNKYQGITVKDYLKFANVTMEQFRENFRVPAEKQIKLRLALEKIVELENISADDEAIEKEYNDMAETYKMDIEKVKAVVSKESLTKDIEVEKAFDLVRENAEISEVTE